MKKLAVLLALALVLASIPAFAAEGDAIVGHEDDGYIYFSCAIPMGDTLCLACGNTLYTYHVGDADLTEKTIAMPEREDGTISDEVMPFAAGGQLYVIDLMNSYSEHAQFEGAELYRLEDDEDGGYRMEKVADVDWGDLVEYYDEDSYAIRPSGVLGAAGKAFIRVYDTNGNYILCAIDLNTGSMERLSEIKDVYNMTLYREDTLLVEQYSYDQPDKVRLLCYDPADESVQVLGELTVPEYTPLTGIAYDAATDTIYCAKGGEICPVDLQAGEVGAGVTDMPLEVYGDIMAFVLEGSYYVTYSEGACIRNLDPEQRAEVRLKINDNSWNDSVNTAYYRFGNAHGDISLVLSRDWNESQNLLENMMNRDDSIDVYVLNSDSSIFDALYKRGYLMELDGSEKLKQFADTMYPDIRASLSSDGHLVALPVDFSSWTLGVNEKALERLGMTLQDVPDNWWDFLDFIAGLEAPLKDNNLHLFYSGYTSQDARGDLFNAIFEDYQRYVNAVDPGMGYNTELLRGLLGKLEQIDFVALGCPEAEEDEDDSMAYSYSGTEYDEDTILLSSSMGCTFGSFYSSFTPVLMGLNADMPMPLVLHASVAFINPYTKHPQEALAYLEELADNLSLSTRYCLDPTLNEPVRGKQNEENAADARRWVEEARVELENADEADKQMLEESINSAEENLAYWEEFGWEVSQREIDWYRSHDDHIVLAGVEWLYADETGEAWELINQYREGGISLDEMLSGIDRKVQMMLLEGN